MHTCGMSDFALRDVYQPTAERVKKMFSAITNFAKYREDQIPLFEDLVAESVRPPSLPPSPPPPTLRMAPQPCSKGSDPPAPALGVRFLGSCDVRFLASSETTLPRAVAGEANA